MRRFNNTGRIKVFLKDPNKKSLLKIVKEVCHLFILKREIPFYYFKYPYKKSVKNYKDYLSTKEVNVIWSSKLLHNPDFEAIFDNKLFFSFFLEKTSIRSPKLIAYNLENTFFFKNKTEIINNKKELILFFTKLFESLKLSAIFIRPLSEYGGKGCFKLSIETMEAEIDLKFQLLIKGCYVITEVIKQHKFLNKIHCNSVNTIRIISLITSKKTVEIISAYIRFGVGKSVVDNASSGGFYVGINIEDGTLNPLGRYNLEYGGNTISEHPNSNIKFKEFKVPYFKEACDEVCKAVELMPDRFIGWDVAIAEDGPTIVEANLNLHIFSSDYAYGGLLKNRYMKELMEELKS